MSYEPPLKITIPTPSEIPQGFGPNSTGGKGGNLRVRCTNAEYEGIQCEAKMLGMSLAMFTRWCTVQIATRLKAHRLLNATSIEAGDEEVIKKQALDSANDWYGD